MATIEGRTRSSIDALLEATVVGGSVDSLGHLILTTQGGAELDGGLIGNQITGRWSSLLNYTAGQIVGYAGQLWRSTTTNINKPPNMHTVDWQRIQGDSFDDWPETDPYFEGKSITTSGDWLFDSYTGTQPAVVLTTIAGEVENSLQSLKVSAAPSASQSFYPNAEGHVRGGDIVEVLVRAKLQSAVASATLGVKMLQNDLSGDPTPGAAGLTTVNASEADVSLTTSWATYRFTVTMASSKPRARPVIKVTAPAGSGAVFLVSYIRIRKTMQSFTATTGNVSSLTVNELLLPGSSQVNPDGSGVMGHISWDSAGKDSEWTNFTPTTANISWAGSATRRGRYKKVGSLVVASITLEGLAGSGTSFTGSPQIDLPIAPLLYTGGAVRHVGQAFMSTTVQPNWITGFCQLSAGNPTLVVGWLNPASVGDLNGWTNTFPEAAANINYATFSIAYEVAP